MVPTRALPCRHVLAIRDTPAGVDLFTAVPTEAGYRISTDRFSGGLEPLLQRVKDDRPDLIVLDFILSGERRGWQVLEWLKRDPVTREIPVIACTAAINQVEALQTQLAPLGVGVVLKPVDLDQLLGELTRVWTGDAPHAEAPCYC